MDKSVLILSDFVGFGDVAMGAARSVLTAMGYHVFCLPTAVFSNTFNYGCTEALDTTEYMARCVSGWEKLGFSFDAVLVGYLAGDAQAAWVAEQCRIWQGRGAVIVLDPIFADDGKLYRGITEDRLTFLRQMLPVTDYVLPNATEAAFLSGLSDGADAAHALRRLGARHVIITGAVLDGSHAVLLSGQEGDTVLPFDPIPGKWNGTGDSFAALFVGYLLDGLAFPDAVRHAMDRTAAFIRSTARDGWQGTGLPLERYFPV